MIDKLKNFDAEKGDVDEMIELSAFARSLEAEYLALNVGAPDWLEPKCKEVRREVSNRLADLREKRIREIRRSLAGLKTAEEKRNDLNEELKRLEASV